MGFGGHCQILQSEGLSLRTFPARGSTTCAVISAARMGAISQPGDVQRRLAWMRNPILHAPRRMPRSNLLHSQFISWLESDAAQTRRVTWLAKTSST